MSSKIRIKRSAVPGKIPTIENLDLGELAVNTHDGKIYLKQEQNEEQSIIEFFGKTIVDNALFVKVNGSDSEDGQSWDSAVASIEKALEIAEQRQAPTLIDIGPGTYETEGNLSVPDNCAVRAAHRSVIIRPKTGFEENNVFLVGSGCFIEGPLFEDWRLDSLENPTVGFAIAFRPDAVILRAPYAHKIAVRTTPYWGLVAPPLDRENANPLVGRGAGVVLADGAVCSPFSVFPNIMTWGATPVSHNGIGYCAKNGALINAVNAISIWAHKHFLAIDGGQIILSSCSTQFGDFTMVSQGSREILFPEEVSIELTEQQTASEDVDTNRQTLLDGVVAEFVNPTESEEQSIRDKTDLLIQSYIWTLLTANEKPMLDFAKSLYDTQANLLFDSNNLVTIITYLRDEINLLSAVNQDSQTIVTALSQALLNTIADPPTRTEPSTITAISHTWTAIFAGVALTKIPPARNQATIAESILELNQGLVIASGQDDQGSALFIGGLEINADTGELSGPPFDQAVNRIATRAAISRSF